MPQTRAPLIYDLALAPLVAAGALVMRLVRKGAVSRLPISLSMLRRAGVFPIRDHYYEPLFNTAHLRRDNNPRELPGVDFALDRQIALLEQFEPAAMLAQLPTHDSGVNEFYTENPTFNGGDAEILFHVIRHFKPARIVEIGSGHSTLMARLAIRVNEQDDPRYVCDHLCIEPFEMPWLEETGVRVLRQRLEDADLSPLLSLDANDILFVDSSHMIRPQGEVLQLYLELIPKLRPGVIVHVHDVFSPRDYPAEWLDHPVFWNEQYLLEAFLTNNDRWETLLAVNMLKHERYDLLSARCPNVREHSEPGSFYIRRL